MRLPNVANILVVDLGGIGDVLISIPALTALRGAYPDAVFDCMVMDRAADVARHAGIFNAVSAVGRGFWRDCGEIIAARRRRYGLVINMRPMTRPAAAAKIFALMAAIGGTVWAGRNTDGLGRFFHVSIPEPLRALKHDRAYARDLVEALGASVVDETVRFPVSSAADDAVMRKLSAAGVGRGRRLVGIHPGGLVSHRWPPERFAAVMRALAGETECIFVFTGNARERRYCDRIGLLARGTRSLNMAGELSIPELGALIRRMDLYIANDTGPIHIAAALGRPLVAIFGPGDLTRFDPRVLDDKASVVYRPSACAPCDRRACRSRLCLEAVAAEEVAREAFRLLRKEQGADHVDDQPGL